MAVVSSWDYHCWERQDGTRYEFVWHDRPELGQIYIDESRRVQIQHGSDRVGTPTYQKIVCRLA